MSEPVTRIVPVQMRADVTPTSIVIVCSCGARTLHTNRARAWLAAADHADRAHPDTKLAARARENSARLEARRT